MNSVGASALEQAPLGSADAAETRRERCHSEANARRGHEAASRAYTDTVALWPCALPLAKHP